MAETTTDPLDDLPPFEPWETAQKMVLPTKFMESLDEAIRDIDFFLGNELARHTLVRAVIQFRKRNNLSQAELSRSLNLGPFDRRLVVSFELNRLTNREQLLLYLNRLKEFAEDTSGFVSWVDVSNERLRFHIDRVRDSLAKTIEAIRQLNDDPSKPLFSSDLAKAQLLAILKASIAELEGPKVDRGRLVQVVRALGRFCSKVVLAGTSAMLGEVLTESVQSGGALLEQLGHLPGADMLDL